MKTKQILISFVVLMTLSCVSISPPQPRKVQDVRHQQKLTELSFEDLASIGHVIFRAFDKKSNRCDIPSQKIFASPQVYRSYLDEKYSEVQEIYLKKPLKDKREFWTTACEKTCSCDVYIGFSEYLEAFNFRLSQTEKSAIEKLRPLASPSEARLSACLDQAQWVCGSQALTDVLKQIDDKNSY